MAGDKGKAACVNLSHLTQMQYDKLTLLNITQPPKMAVEKSNYMPPKITQYISLDHIKQAKHHTFEVQGQQDILDLSSISNYVFILH